MQAATRGDAGDLGGDDRSCARKRSAGTAAGHVGAGRPRPAGACARGGRRAGSRPRSRAASRAALGEVADLPCTNLMSSMTCAGDAGDDLVDLLGVRRKLRATSGRTSRSSRRTALSPRSGRMSAMMVADGGRHLLVTVASVHRQHQVGLLGLGRQAGGRAAALDVDDQQRQLKADRQTDRLALERDAGPEVVTAVATEAAPSAAPMPAISSSAWKVRTPKFLCLELVEDVRRRVTGRRRRTAAARPASTPRSTRTPAPGCRLMLR